MDRTRFTTCELRINTKSQGWHDTLTKMLGGIKEVTYTIDAQMGIGHVSGRINPNRLLKLLAKARKHVEILRVDSGQHHDFGAPPPGLVHENGYDYHSPLPPPYYEQVAPPQPPPPLPPVPHTHYPYYEPGFRQHDAYYDPDAQCSIM